jgi:DNA polymerase V
MQRFALSDCNNFYASCERIFNPQLIGKPVIVLSSNDACVIARSNEAKALGIKMGEPFFRIKDLVKKHAVYVFSANFALYGDISSRVMSTLSSFATDIEIYSVDEAFMFLPTYHPAIHVDQERFYTEYAKHIRYKVLKNIGIPISIGMGPTKTLAKIANGIAKKRADGVFDITNHPQQDALLASIAVEDVWGIGYRYKKKLAHAQIFNALQLKHADQRWIRKNLTIAGLRTVQELNGIACIELAHEKPRETLCVSRSFGKNLSAIHELKTALANHVTRAAEKLRNQKSICSNMMIFLCYRSHADQERLYLSSGTALLLPTAYTPTLLNAAFGCLQKIYKPGYIYKKIGVILTDVQPEQSLQLSTLSHISPHILEKQHQVSKAMDRINAKFNRKVSFAANGFDKDWTAKAEQRSARFTTDWNDILTINI